MGNYGAWKGTPREQIPWYPSVDPAKCVGCRKCHEFCSHAVYGWDEVANTPVVMEPFQCVVGCSSCSQQCEEGAISFPLLTILQPFLSRA
jgi:NAD-dependent dihydropyrimidine dehydrogenase PreA subunit